MKNGWKFLLIGWHRWRAKSLSAKIELLKQHGFDDKAYRLIIKKVGHRAALIELGVGTELTPELMKGLKEKAR